MNERRILTAVFLLLALGAGYLSFVLWRADESGKWLFLVFAVFFLVLAVAPLGMKFGRERVPTPPTGFVSHAFMTLMIAVVVIGVLAAIVIPLLRN